MKLYLVQHGEAVPKDEDPERPLSARGELDVHAVAAMIRDAGITLERVWHSGKRRAEQTANIFAAAVLTGGVVEVVRGISPNDPVAEFASDADVWEGDTLVVGHLPFMSRLVALLAGKDQQSEIVQYYPGSIICLERVAVDRWVIIWMIRPDIFAGPR
jgi:phosphohistidine phosphatase